MLRYLNTACLAFLALIGNRVLAEDHVDDQLHPFIPLIGKTWKGEFKGPSSENSAIDVSRWERALNGKAIRILHSLNDGQYGGESLIFWDSQREEIISIYVTTAGFYTEGTITFKEGQFHSQEFVKGNQNGITEVRAIGELLPDGTLLNKAQYLKDGEWTAWQEVIYREDPTAKVILK
ncbi:MAG: hypothetical protein JSW33_06200 [bacterium]|nr:MAG: hypothetical protein JSW33_06200 [bacterium]